MKTMIALAALVVAAPVLAGAPKSGSWQVGNDSFHIYYADLDTTTMAGRAALLARAEKAAVRLCHAATGVEEKDCVADILTNVPSPSLQLAMNERNAVQHAGK